MCENGSNGGTKEKETQENETKGRPRSGYLLIKE